MWIVGPGREPTKKGMKTEVGIVGFGREPTEGERIEEADGWTKTEVIGYISLSADLMTGGIS